MANTVSYHAAVAAIAGYYRSPAVRSRLGEYCGGDLGDASSLSALSFAAYGGVRRLREADGAPSPVPMEAVPRLLDEGADLCRSLADRQGTLLVFDVDYTNHDDPAEPYREPARIFTRLEPVFTATLRAFEATGVHPLAVMTGRGYDFVAKARHGTPLRALLARLGRPEPGRASARAAGEDGQAHEGAGRLLEVLAHEVARSVAGRTEVPVALMYVAPPEGGRTAVIEPPATGPTSTPSPPAVPPHTAEGPSAGSAELGAAKRAQMQAHLNAARAADARGDEKQCFERLGAARAIPEPG